MTELFTVLVDDNDARPVTCDNCEWTGLANDLLPISNFDQRVPPGELVPAGECPECGCLAHIVTAVNCHADLLAALEEIASFTYDRELIDGQEFDMESDDAVETLGHCIEQARAAVAKARGE